MLMSLMIFGLIAVTGTASDQPTPDTQTAKQPAETEGNQVEENVEKPAIPGLEQIESFEVEMDESWLSETVIQDETTALIVNPFSVRKRGRYYGSVYIYHRNDNFDARNAFDPGKKPEYKRNQFGLSLGALITNKLKVFGSYDGLRIVRGSTNTSLVPTAAMKQGDFSNIPWKNENFKILDPSTGIPFENNLIPQSRIHTVARNLLSLFPDPNVAGEGYNFVNSDPDVENNDTISARVDYELSSHTKIFGNYEISDGDRERAVDLPNFANTTTQRDQRASIDLTHSFSPSRVLNVGLRFSREVSLTLSPFSFQEGLLESVGIEGVRALDPMDEGYPKMSLQDYVGIGASSGFTGFPGFPGGGFAGEAPESFHENRYGIEASYTYIRGRHNFVFGGELNITQLNNMRTWGKRRGEFGYSGAFTGDSFGDFLLGIPYTATRGLGSDRSDLRQKPWRLYVQDSWKINRFFTVTAGLAYTFTPFFNSIRDNVSFFYPVVFEPPLDGEVIVTGSERARELGLKLDPGQAAYNDKNDWQPSVAVAYSPFGNNRLVLRASYRIWNDDMNPIQALTYMGRNYPFFYLESAESPNQPDLDIGNPFESAVVPALNFNTADPYLRNPFMQQRDFSIQYEFLPNWSLELAYEGRKTDRYFRVIPANVPLPGPGDLQNKRPNPEYGFMQILKSDASYSRNAMQIRVTRRLTTIFSLSADFRWEKSLTNSWGWMNADPNNPRDLDAERSVQGFMPMKRLGLNYIIDLPIGKDKLLSSRWAGKLAPLIEGWRISGITNIMGGRPFSVQVFGDPNNDGVYGDRPNRIGSGTIPSSERTIGKWFETSDFAMPDYYGEDPEWFGNAGRNILMSPGSTQWDISLLKRTRVTTSGHFLELRVQFFNAFNHVNLRQPGNFIGVAAPVTPENPEGVYLSPTFGVITSAGNAREIEIALKYTF